MVVRLVEKERGERGADQGLCEGDARHARRAGEEAGDVDREPEHAVLADEDAPVEAVEVERLIPTHMSGRLVGAAAFGGAPDPARSPISARMSSGTGGCHSSPNRSQSSPSRCGRRREQLGPVDSVHLFGLIDPRPGGSPRVPRAPSRSRNATMSFGVRLTNTPLLTDTNRRARPRRARRRSRRPAAHRNPRRGTGARSGSPQGGQRRQHCAGIEPLLSLGGEPSEFVEPRGERGRLGLGLGGGRGPQAASCSSFAIASPSIVIMISVTSEAMVSASSST